MKTITIVVGFGVALLCNVARAGEIPAARAGPWFCQSIHSDPTATLYASDVFGGTFDGSEVKSAFQNTLKAQHGVAIQVSCSMAYDTPGIREKIDADHQRWFTQIRNGGGTVVETHWTFEPAKTTFAYECFGGAGSYLFMNERRAIIDRILQRDPTTADVLRGDRG